MHSFPFCERKVNFLKAESQKGKKRKKFLIDRDDSVLVEWEGILP